MKKIVILGCENSHADAFLDCIANLPEFSHMEVIGIYSNEPAAAQKLHDRFGVPIMASYDEAVGKVDGVVITARHGANHFPYAKPYIDSGVPMFIDKPITVDEDEAVEFMYTLKEKGVKVTGGSSLRHAFGVRTVKQACECQNGGPTVGGIVRAPLHCDNPYGGFFFYAQQLVEMVLEAFGRNPQAVQVSTDVKGNRTVLFHYDTFTVTGLYTEGSNEYYAARFALNGSQGGFIPTQGKEWYHAEFSAFSNLLNGGEMELSYEELIAPVFVMNAIDRASASGQVEPVCYGEV